MANPVPHLNTPFFPSSEVGELHFQRFLKLQNEGKHEKAQRHLKIAVQVHKHPVAIYLAAWRTYKGTHLIAKDEANGIKGWQLALKLGIREAALPLAVDATSLSRLSINGGATWLTTWRGTYSYSVYFSTSTRFVQ